TVHDLGYRYFPGAHRVVDRRYLDVSTRWNAAAARWVLADSEATKQDLIKFYRSPPDKIKVVYPGLDAEWAEASASADQIESVRSRYGIAGDYILAVGTIHPRKNYVRLVEAVSALPADCRLVIAGQRGWLYESLFESIRRLNLDRRVTLLDYVASADLAALYAGARLMVMPSLYEGFGFPVLEAQASGIPVACSNTSSLPEVAGDAALFFDPTSVSSIREAVDRLWRDDERRNNLIARGRVNIKRFVWPRAAQQILALLSA
ncbi:MAG: glycosyltransferase family 4 protein, partial [Rudaea sp.]